MTKYSKECIGLVKPLTHFIIRPKGFDLLRPDDTLDRKEEEEMPFYRWNELDKDMITPEYSSAKGPNIRGEKIEVGLFFYPAGT